MRRQPRLEPLRDSEYCMNFSVLDARGREGFFFLVTRAVYGLKHET